ncbi:MAG: bifunctional phosphoglucose/phosphomannose isomerase [Candidatus Margulisiibacteriota bacterium]
MNSLDDEKKIKEIDKSGMLEVAQSAPQMIREAFKMMEFFPAINLKGIDSICIAGMGGSAVAGDLLSNLLRDQLPVPVFVNRNYTLPVYLKSSSLIFISSYSGDTEETVSCLKEAEGMKAKIICLTSDGKVKAAAEAKKYPLVDLKKGLQPRAALPYFLVSIAMILEKGGLIKDVSSQINESASVLDQLKNSYGQACPERQNPAKQMARRLIGKLPVIFASNSTTEAIGKRLKNQLNENSKMNALLCTFPEMNHNEMVSLSQLNKGEHNFAAVFVRDEEDHVRVNKRIEITKSMLGAKLGGAMEIPSSGKTRLARMFSQIFFSDILSVYLAIIAGIDPTPVDAITKFKKEMAR